MLRPPYRPVSVYPFKFFFLVRGRGPGKKFFIFFERPGAGSIRKNPGWINRAGLRPKRKTRARIF